MRTPSLCTAPSFALFLTLAGLAPAQAQLGADSTTITAQTAEAIDVRLINIDVVVTDKKGNPVTGLTRSDFRVSEDRQEVDISHFAYVAPEAWTGSASNVSEGSADSAAPLPSTTEPLTTILYLDLDNTYPQHRQRVRSDLKQYLEETGTPSRWILASYQNRLEIHAGPTLNSAQLLDHLPAKSDRSSKGTSSTLDERATYRQIRDSFINCESMPFCEPCVDNWEEMLSYARSHAIGERARAQVAIGGIADLLGAVSGISGRKEVLYVGDGFHQRGGIASFGYVADICEGERPQAQNEVFRMVLEHDSTTQMKQLTAYANANRVTINMLDTAGVHSGLRSSVDFASAKVTPTMDNDRLRMENIQGSHHVLADETGGAAILNSNRPHQALVAFDSQLSEGAYSLGFTPNHPPTGRKHNLRVELVGKAAKGNRLRYRRSYQDKKLEARLVDRLVSGLYFDDNENPLGVKVSVGEPVSTTKKLAEVPVTVTLDRTAFLNLPAQTGTSSATAAPSGQPKQAGKARVWLRAVSDRGARSSVRQTFVDVPPSTPENTTDTVVVTMTVETGGTYTIAVGVRDELTQAVSVVRSSVEVGRASS